MTQRIQSVVIVGDGTAGWLTAGTVAARHQTRMKAGSFSVTASYQYALYGMGYATEVTPEDTFATASLASLLRQEKERLSQELRARLPRNRELLNKINEYGLQSI